MNLAPAIQTLQFGLRTVGNQKHIATPVNALWR